MTGITVTSGTEDLTSGLVNQGKASLEGCEEALLDMFFPAGASKDYVDAAVEGLAPKAEVPAMQAQENVLCPSDDRRRPLVSKVIDKETGAARITIIFDGLTETGGNDIGVICSLINNATANDIVDLTIATYSLQFGGTTSNMFGILSLLNAMRGCKAKTITRAGCLMSISDCAIWLTGKDRRMGPMGWLAVRQPAGCGGGTLQDTVFRVEDVLVQVKTLTDFIVSKGLLTEEEVKLLFEEQAMISLSYDDLNARLSNLKA